MKKIISLILSASLVLSFGITSMAAGGMDNFQKTKTYQDQFTDVAAGQWYRPYVKVCYEYGLLNGKSATDFQPGSQLTVAETIAMADRIHSVYNTGEISLHNGSPWYQPYVDYAIRNDIIDDDDFSNYNRPITRGEMAHVFADALPDQAMPPVNTVSSIPDVNSATPYADEITELYQAGILTGKDSAGSFQPDSNLLRNEAAAVMTRMALPVQRVTPSGSDTGTGSLIGISEAQDIALNAAGAQIGQVYDLDLDMDWEFGKQIYEISFDFNGREYEYDIDAQTGEIIKSQVPGQQSGAPAAQPQSQTEPQTQSGELIGMDEAKRVALSSAGFQVDQIYDLDIDLDWEQGQQVYEVSFEVNGQDYDYDIDAVTGAIVRSQVPGQQSGTPAAQPQSQPASQTQSGDVIGMDNARDAALRNAGFTVDQVYDLDIDLDWEQGQQVYDVSFEVNGQDYDYDIDAVTGEIVWSQVPAQQNSTPAAQPQSQPAPQTQSGELIGMNGARDTALTSAGFTSGQVYDLEVDLDWEQGRQVYEVSFEVNGQDYDYDIDAVTGEIIKSEIPGKTNNSRSSSGSQSSQQSSGGSSSSSQSSQQSSGGSSSSSQSSQQNSGGSGSSGQSSQQSSGGSGSSGQSSQQSSGGSGSSGQSSQQNSGGSGSSSQSSQQSSGSSSSGVIGSSTAQNTALSAAGVQSGEVRDLEVELDRDDGRDVYEISFSSGGYDYDYEIDANTGNIIRSDREWDD